VNSSSAPGPESAQAATGEAPRFGGLSRRLFGRGLRPGGAARLGILGGLGALAACIFAACGASRGEGPRAAGDDAYALIDQLGRVLVQIENEYVDPVDRAKLVSGAIKGMVAELDPHSSYMPPEEFRAFEGDTEGQFGGIGIEVEGRNGQLVVLSPIEGSPAERAGIRSGDIVVAVDARDPTAEPFEMLVKRLRGPPGSHVKVSIRRGDATEPLRFDLVREVIHVTSVSYKLLMGSVAYLRIKQFQDHTHDELLEAAGKLRARSGGTLAGVILDLRSDPGGLVDQAADVADEFLDDGVIYTARHRGQIIDQVSARAGGAFSHEPCVVLVDQYTASASELVAGALQDHRRATVVGERTFGKGSVQAILSLPGGAGMRLTVSRYYTPSGHAIQADGVHPDVAIVREHDNAVVSFREKDLDGHLAAEATPVADGQGSARVVVIGADAGTSPESVGKEAKGVPDDPDQGTDAILKVGWQVLRQPSHSSPPP
jgi:carboxyl-terminal processing protease